MKPVVSELRSVLLRRGLEPERVARRAVRSPEVIAQLLEGLDDTVGAVRFAAARVLRCVSRDHPGLLYPCIEELLGRLDEANRFLACDIRLILGNLARVDTARRLDDALDRYFAPLAGPIPMVAATTIKGAEQLGLGRLDLVEEVVRRLLLVSGGHYGSAMAKNVVLGHAIEAIDTLLPEVADPAPVLQWVRRHRRNPRSATREQALRLLAHWDS